VDPERPEAWARALERLLGDPALAARLGAAARRRAREDFPLERTINRTMALYHECLARSC
jgi:glycosyltransferase involved in cell wall biosynthesis